MSDLRKAAEQALEALMQTTLEDVMVEVEPNVWEYKSIVAIQALRQALAHEALNRMVAENQRLGLYDEDNPQVTGEVTTEVPCKTHPDAPHGFNRSASFDEDRYVCDCEFWEPVDNPYTKLDTTAGVLHKEWVGLSEDEFEKILETHNEAMPFAVYLSIEAKLKQKNVP